MEDEANRYRTLLEKLRVAPAPPPAAKPAVASEEDAGWRIAAVDVTAQKRLDSQRFGRGPGGDEDPENPK